MAELIPILRFREEWPLWSVEKRIYERIGQVWVELDDVPDLTSKGTEGLCHLVNELRRLEHTLLHDGIVGWIASVKHGNARMQRALMAIGATQYASDPTYHYYQKVAGAPAIPAGVLATARQMRQQEVGHA